MKERGNERKGERRKKDSVREGGERETVWREGVRKRGSVTECGIKIPGFRESVRDTSNIWKKTGLEKKGQ